MIAPILIGSGINSLNLKEISNLNKAIRPKHNFNELENEIIINKNTKIFLSHGTNDEVLNIGEGRKIKSFIETKNLILDYHEFNIGHQIIPDQMFELNKWIEQI